MKADPTCPTSTDPGPYPKVDPKSSIISTEFHPTLDFRPAVDLALRPNFGAFATSPLPSADSLCAAAALTNVAYSASASSTFNDDGGCKSVESERSGTHAHRA